jgi:hypothetical protein
VEREQQQISFVSATLFLFIRHNFVSLYSPQLCFSLTYHLLRQHNFRETPLSSTSFHRLTLNSPAHSRIAFQ